MFFIVIQWRNNKQIDFWLCKSFHFQSNFNIQNSTQSNCFNFLKYIETTKEIEIFQKENKKPQKPETPDHSSEKGGELYRQL